MNNEKFDSEEKVQKTCNSKRLKPPKRNKNRFLIFSHEVRGEVKEQTGLNSNLMMVEIAKRWKKLSEEQKDAYNAPAAKDKARYEDELRIFSQQHPDRLIKNRTKYNYTKKSASGYGIFVREMKDIIRKQMPPEKRVMADILSIIGGLWKKLCQEEVAHYKKRSEYEKELRRIAVRERLKKKGRRSSQTRTDQTAQIMAMPKPQKKVKGVSGKPSMKVQAEEEVKRGADYLKEGEELELQMQVTTSDPSQSESNFELEAQNDEIPHEKSFLIDDYEFLLTAWKLSKKKSIMNLEQQEELLDQEDRIHPDEEVDLFEFVPQGKKTSKTEEDFWKK